MNEKLFLDLENNEQKEILMKLKRKLDLTWKNIADLLNVNRSMVFFYLNEKCKLPYKSFLVLCKAAEIDPKDFEIRKLTIVKNSIQPISKPQKTNKELAEFLGILAGDGCLTRGYEVTVTCNAIVDKPFVVNRVAHLFNYLFEITPRIRIQKNTICCYSKELYSFLSNEYNFPIGEKKNRLFIPERIRQNSEFLVCFLRGVFDTDGSFYKHHKNTATVEFISCSQGFLYEIYFALKKLNLKPSLSRKGVRIYDTEKIDTFFNTIKPNNIKHLLKYQKFKETGRVPSHEEIKASVV